MHGKDIKKCECTSIARLADSLKSGRDCAYLRLVSLFGKKIYRLALSIVKNSTDAEDIVQEVFLDVYSKIDTLKENKALSSWIYRTTVNASMMKVREYGSSQEVHFEEDVSRFDPEGRHLSPVKDWSENPEAKVFSHEVMNYINENIKEIPLPYKVVFLLRDVEGLSNEDVADMLKISLSAVKSRLHRARMFMRGQLSKYFEREVV